MSNLDITTLKEKLKNIPTPRPRTIDWCDESVMQPCATLHRDNSQR